MTLKEESKYKYIPTLEAPRSVTHKFMRTLEQASIYDHRLYLNLISNNKYICFDHFNRDRYIMYIMYKIYDDGYPILEEEYDEIRAMMQDCIDMNTMEKLVTDYRDIDETISFSEIMSCFPDSYGDDHTYTTYSILVDHIQYKEYP